MLDEGFLKTHRYEKRKKKKNTLRITWNVATSAFSVHCRLYQQTCYNLQFIHVRVTQMMSVTRLSQIKM